MKDPATDPNVVGWCGVLLTSHNEYQGFLITKDMESTGQQTVSNGRAVMKAEGSNAASSVMAELDTVAPEDQALLGALCAGLVDCYMKGKAMHVGALAAAVRHLSKLDYFWIMADSKPEGVKTTIMALKAASAVQARAAFETQPPVMFVQTLRAMNKDKR